MSNVTIRGMGRRAALAGFASLSLGAAGKAADYEEFLSSVRRTAEERGVPADVVTRALSLTRVPNEHVLKLDRHQPEFTLTWSQYRARVIGPKRIGEGRQSYRQQASLLRQIEARYGVDPGPVMGIWGLESGFGALIGSFLVIDALATLAFDTRRAAFFRGELLNALTILGAREIAPEAMLGSYAGAMGQPQFMPSAYLRYAVDFDGDGRRDIWRSRADALASVANYLAHSGWVRGEPWGQAVLLTQPLAPASLGRGNRRPLSAWMQAGVRRADGRPFSRGDVTGAIVQPDGPGTDAFMVYRNFDAIRRYNPSDFYALGVGLLGYEIT